MGEFSITHLLLLLAIFLVFFGPSKLPALGESIGKAVRGFKQAMNEIEVEARDIPPDQLSDKTNSTTNSSTAKSEKDKA